MLLSVLSELLPTQSELSPVLLEPSPQAASVFKLSLAELSESRPCCQGVPVGELLLALVLYGF
jgi:hypothetical protein